MLFALFQHPKPNYGRKPAIAPHEHANSGKAIIRQRQEQNDQGGNKEGYWVSQLFEKPTDSLLVLFNGFLALFTARLYIATKGLFDETRGLRKAADQQAHDMKRSLVIAKESADAAVASEAAWVFETIRIYNFREGWYGTSEGNERRVEVRYAIKNFGKTPAIIGSYHIDVIIANDPPLPDAEFFSEMIGDERPIEILGADEESGELECSRKTISLTKAQETGLPRGYLHLWIVGHVHFEDVFGKRRARLFCYKYDSSHRRLIPYSIASEQNA